MTPLLKVLSLGAVLLASVPSALADQISFLGSDTFNTTATTITFFSAAVGVTGTGILSPFTTASTVVMNSFNYGTPPATFVLFTATAPTGQTLSYLVTSESFTNNLVIMGDGTYTLTNGTTVTTATGSFKITTQGNGSLTTFSNINLVTAVPEPTSMLFLGTGLLGIGGLLRRRLA